MSDYSNYRKPNTNNQPYFSAKQYFKDNLRVLRKNLLFCSGLPLTLTQDDLKSPQYFGKYGTVLKVTLLKSIRQMSVYITYSDPYQASLAIIATNDFELDKYHKLASIYGTIKYCKYFLKKIQCKNLPNCNYLHVFDKKNQIYINNQLPDQVFDEHYHIALGLLKQVDIDKMIKEKVLTIKKITDFLPCPIEALNRIAKQRYLGNDLDQDHGQNSQDQVISSCSDCSDKICSQQQTYETISSQIVEPIQIKNQDFPRLQTLQIIQKRQKSQIKQKIKSPQRSQLKSPQKIKLFSLQQYQPIKIKPTQQNPNNESLQIKLIRKLLRQPSSKLTAWTDIIPQVQEIQQIQFFHKQLSELNELRQICESNILKQMNKQQERVKFLLIKNIHHGKRHIHLGHHQHYLHTDKRGRKCQQISSGK